MFCKTCGAKRHYCSKCERDLYYDLGYCDKECFEKSEEYNVYIPKLKKFWESLNEEQQKDLWSLWDNGIFYEGLYEEYVDKVIVLPDD